MQFLYLVLRKIHNVQVIQNVQFKCRTLYIQIKS